MSPPLEIDDIASNIQNIRIDKAHEHLDASKKNTSQSPHGTDSPLLKLPNELLIQITCLLAPNQRVDKNGGFGLDLEQRHELEELEELDEEEELFPQETIALRQSHAQNTQDILNLGLTCRRLSDVAQNVLYKKVALLQARISDKQKTNLALTCFLRTIIKRPDLAAYVRHFAVWIWRDRPVRRTAAVPSQPKAINQRDPDDVPQRPKPICICRTCFSKLILIVNTTHAASEQITSWTRDIKATPSEATVCALILACLPNLRNVAIYARPHPAAASGQPRPEGLAREYVNDASQPDNSDVVRLSYALNMAKHLKELTISTHLNGLATHARLPTLTSLTVDFSSSHQFVSVPKTSFRNVTHLAIRARLQDFLSTNTLNNPRLDYASSFREKFGILLRNLPSIRTLEFESGTAVSQCYIPPHVEKVVLRPIKPEAVPWLANIGSKGMEGSWGSGTEDD
ncbi:hypothetical protein N0V83_001961 [Neocucurbitaria cava]|uniref:F-box domain-containing protein n=1 Tax=Neocucurbitaria cava TaxID=798079 RepID=A0A9W8YEC1_9PLEO|nr:hypothetical protein N0V83_001961 [Neocucurbitaria cava]